MAKKSITPDASDTYSRAEILYMMLADALFTVQTGEPVTATRERVLTGVSDDDRADLANLIHLRRQFYKGGVDGSR